MDFPPGEGPPVDEPPDAPALPAAAPPAPSASVAAAPRPRPDPKPVEEVLAEAWDLYRLHFRSLVSVAAVGLLPVSLAKDLLVAAFTQGGGASAPAALVGAFVLMTPVLALAHVLTQGALIAAAADAVAGGEAGLVTAWRTSLDRLATLFGVTLLVTTGTMLGLLLCVLPGIAFGLGCLFVTPAVVLEGRDAMSAVQRSLAAFRADWGRTVVVALAVGVLALGAGMVGGLLVPPGHLFIGAIASDVVALVVMPFPVLALVLLFEDIQRARWGLPEAEIRRQADRLVGDDDEGNDAQA
jgi:hypothetical protein